MRRRIFRVLYKIGIHFKNQTQFSLSDIQFNFGVEKKNYIPMIFDLVGKKKNCTRITTFLISVQTCIHITVGTILIDRFCYAVWQELKDKSSRKNAYLPVTCIEKYLWQDWILLIDRI